MVGKLNVQQSTIDNPQPQAESMDHLFPIQHAYLIPLLPLIGAMIAGFFGAKWLKGLSHLLIWAGVGASAVLSIWILVAMVGRWEPHHGAHGEGAAHAEVAAHPEHGSETASAHGTSSTGFGRVP